MISSLPVWVLRLSAPRSEYSRVPPARRRLVRGRQSFQAGSSMLSFHCAIQPGSRPMANSTVEHVGGESDGPQHDAAVKIHIRVQVVRDEVVVPQGDLFPLERDVPAAGPKALSFSSSTCAICFHDSGPAVVGACKRDGRTRPAGRDPFYPWRVPPHGPDCLWREISVSISITALVGAAVQRSPQGRDAGRDGRVQVHPGAADHPAPRRSNSSARGRRAGSGTRSAL